MLCLKTKTDPAAKADTSRVKIPHREHLDTYSNFGAVDFFCPFAIMKVDICREQSRTGAARECMLLDIQGGVQYGADDIQRADGRGA